MGWHIIRESFFFKSIKALYNIWDKQIVEILFVLHWLFIDSGSEIILWELLWIKETFKRCS